MEFDFNINSLFPETITLVNHVIVKERRWLTNGLYRNLQTVVDVLGKRSANAQQLTGSITNLEKSKLNGYNIYILKDPAGNRGLGTVIGFIKIGKKRLFVLDKDGNHNEMYPHCILDFYVHESHQRKGCGLLLFKHMLKEENVNPAHLAIDRPSLKFISFLKKHFNLWATISQVNNFVVYDGFFKNRSDYNSSNNSRNSRSRLPSQRPLSRAVSDDIIKRIRHNDCTSFSTSLKGIRPASSTTLLDNQLSTTTVRRKKWNLDGSAYTPIGGGRPPMNMFSRFAHTGDAQKQALPPLPPSRRRKHDVDDIITNPYRRHTSYSANPNTRNETMSSDYVMQLRRKDDESLNGFPTKTEIKVTGDDHYEPSMMSKVNKKSASNVAVHRPHVYQKPSDMITELRQKDNQSVGIFPTKNSFSDQSQKMKNWQHGHLGGGNQGSWNVLGVPNWSFWKNK